MRCTGCCSPRCRCRRRSPRPRPAAWSRSCGWRNVDPGSNAGLPGLSLPAGLSDDGLPIGLEVDGLPGEDRKILAVGVALEPLLGRLAPPPA